MKRESILAKRKIESDVFEPYGYIYITTNLINYKKYIGKHAKSEFDKSYLGSGRELKLAIQKYGRENFICEPIEWVKSAKALDEREYWWTQYLEVVKDVNYYNEIEGGTGYHGGKLHPFYGGENHPMKCKHHSEETKRKMSISKLGKHISEETKQKIKFSANTNPNYGMRNKHHTKESRQKMRGPRKSVKGVNNPNYGNHKKLLPSHRAKIKESMQKYTGGNNAHSSSVIQLTFNGEFVREFSYLSECKKYGFNVSCISDCCRGCQKTHKGYKWIYKKDYIKSKGVD